MTRVSFRSLVVLTSLILVFSRPAVAGTPDPAATASAGSRGASHVEAEPSHRTEVAQARRAKPRAKVTKVACARRVARPALKRAQPRGRFRSCPPPAPVAPAPAPTSAPAREAAPTPQSSPAPHAGPDPQAAPAPAHSSDGDASDYGFLFADERYGPGRWNPCRPIPYRVNPHRAPQGGLADLEEALHRVSEATGLTFAYNGTTSEVPTRANTRTAGSEGAVIAWATQEESDLLSGATGVGGGTAVTTAGGTLRIFRGYVVLDAAQRLATGFQPGASHGTLLLHELGHMVGLDHSRATGQIMYATLTSKTPSLWGAGDRTGLARLGSASGCLS